MEFDGSLERKEFPEIPVDAVREAVINAFGHRIIESGQSVEVAENIKYHMCTMTILWRMKVRLWKIRIDQVAEDYPKESAPQNL